MAAQFELYRVQTTYGWRLQDRSGAATGGPYGSKEEALQAIEDLRRAIDGAQVVDRTDVDEHHDQRARDDATQATLRRLLP